MTQWKKNAKEFDEFTSKSKNRDDFKSLICRIPKPIIESLDNPDSLLFKMVKNKVSIEVENK